MCQFDECHFLFGVRANEWLCASVDRLDVLVEQLLLIVVGFSIIVASILYHLHRSWLCVRSGSIPVIMLRSHFHCKRLPNHFHCITDSSTKLDYDKRILISHEIFFEQEVAIKGIGDLPFSDCRIYVWKGVLCRFLSSSVLVSSVQLPTSMSNTGGTWDNAKKDISTS